MASSGGHWIKGKFEPASVAGSLSPKALQEVLWTENFIRGYSHEECLAILPDGTEILRKAGGKSEINFTDDEVARMKDAVFTHNHPLGNGFSVEDGQFASLANLAEIRATGTNSAGETYLHVLRRPKIGWPSPETMQQALRFRWDAVYEDWSVKVAKNQLDPYWAGNNHSHEVYSNASKLMGIEYRRIKL